jgi:hypothetical protein
MDEIIEKVIDRQTWLHAVAVRLRRNWLAPGKALGKGGTGNQSQNDGQTIAFQIQIFFQCQGLLNG